MKQELQFLSVIHLVVKLMTLGPDSAKFQAYPLEFLKSVTFSEANIEYFEAKFNTSVLEHCITCCATMVNRACSFQELTSPS